MESNDLNFPPTEEPFVKKLSRIASQLIVPVLLPASSVFVGWLAQRRLSIQLSELRKEKQQIDDLKENMESLQAEMEVLIKKRDVYEGNVGITTIKRRQLQEESILKEEEESTEKVLKDLEELRPLLKQRQDIFCSHLQYRGDRLKIEEELKHTAYAKPYDKELGLYMGMKDILQNDKSCGPKTNGCLMWLYFQFWETQAKLLQNKRVAARMKSFDESFTE
ncbi:coiled-coil domain-containing protein 127-like [Patiria miniata]|uniref:Coiled-coil domain-containing protein 127 n=1 Tax=Patiria miniata TaxID=46514 RepID=A0A913ZMA8_PATMI|nr:coiled-coil domain-containing protein 127-like [Patiria miniata]XP_038052202.1 coiled-coil domain-containing protein 127-like [Patiria miniata]